MKRNRHVLPSKRGGMAMIVVLCVMSLMLVLCLSLLYGAAQVTANSEKRLEQVRAYQLARTLSGAVGEALSAETLDSVDVGDHRLGTVYYSVQQFLMNEGAATDVFTVTEGLPDNCRSVTFTLEKSDTKVPALFKQVGRNSWLYVGEDGTSWISYDHQGDQIESMGVPLQGNSLGNLVIVVQVDMMKASAVVTSHFSCQADFAKRDYYVGEGGSYRLYLSPVDKMFYYDSSYTNPYTFDYAVIEQVENTETGVLEDVTVWKSAPMGAADVDKWGQVRVPEDAVEVNPSRIYSGFLGDMVPYKLTYYGEV